MKTAKYFISFIVALVGACQTYSFGASVQEQLPSSEYSALVDLYNQTKGADWSNNEGWLTNDPVWYGVVITGVQYDTNGAVIATGHVASISLDTNNLIGTLPTSLGNLIGLQYLSIRGSDFISSTVSATNGLEGTIPDVFGDMTNLTYVDLSVNQLTNSIPASLYNSSYNTASLQHLNLHGNQLTGGIPAGLAYLSALTDLDLGLNQLGGTIPDIWAGFSILGTLDLSGNGFTGIIPRSLTQMPEIKTIYLDGNQLSGDVPLFGNNIYYLGIDRNWLTTAAGTLSMSNIDQMLAEGIDVVYIPNGITFTQVRVPLEYSTASPADPIDSSIVPIPDADTLAISFSAAPPLGFGVAADGVTPVLVGMTPIGTGRFTIQITDDAIAYTNGPLSTNLFILYDSRWVRAGEFSIPTCGSGSSPPGAGPGGGFGGNCPNIGFTYLQGLNWNDFVTAPGANEVTISLIVGPVWLPGVYFTNTFKVRPPPVALVHGIAADATEWSSSFTNELAKYVPADFIVPVTYGKGDGPANLWPNAVESLPVLSVMLDNELRRQLETPLLTNWDFTRYDVVGHSQGGILARMLCQTNSLGRGQFSFQNVPVVSATNQYRGRFRRLITIGAPHNGSLIAWYVWKMRDTVDSADLGWFSLLQSGLFNVLATIATDKFDPFGSSISNVNSTMYPLDGRIGFNCIQTAITGGEPPVDTLWPFAAPPCYYLPGLCFPTGILGQSRGDVLLPDGSDGAVDFDSEGGGNGSAQMPITNNDISHEDIPFLFGVPAGQSQTTYLEVADTVGELLAGPTNSFGPFILPTPLPSSSQQTYQSTLVLGTVVMNLINLLPLPLIPTTNYQYQLQVPTNLPNSTPISWFAFVFGTNGLETNGVSIQVDTNDSTQATVTVSGSEEGQVVLTASYIATNGQLVYAIPVVAPYNPVGSLAGLALYPKSATLALGDSISTSVWGDYSNGAQGLLYVPPGGATFLSSDTNVASVDANGTVTMNSNGHANISVIYEGFTGRMRVSSLTPSLQVASNPRGSFSYTWGTLPGLAYQIQSTTDLAADDWNDLGSPIIATNTLTTMCEPLNASSQEFYRVVLLY